ncbi:MAG: peptidase M22 [Clostridia bacterium]|nr:peptidase M22 [Clostridia bacterium]
MIGNSPCFVGIDTSNYTTSASVADMDGNIIANLKQLLPVDDGARGLRQSDAVFAHVKNLPDILDGIGEALCGRGIAAVGCSVSPRDTEGSYMPCFLVGKNAAHAFAAASGAPLYGFSHQNGHIMAALYSSGAMHLLSEKEFAAFHVSGGTTEILLVKPCDSSFSVELIGGTSDLNGGQAIDRVGVAMGLHFPCGREMEGLALKNTEKIPKFKLSVKGLECNISGLENQARKLYSDTGNRELTSASVFDFMGRTLNRLTENLTEEYGDIPIVYAGGVMSNSIIKNMLSARKNTFFALPEFSSDNAAGTALLCRKKYLSENGVNNGSI